MSLTIPSYEEIDKLLSLPRQDYSILKDLIKNKKILADHRKNSQKDTILMAICETYTNNNSDNCDLNMIKFLLENGANPNACKYYLPEYGNQLFVDFCSMPLYRLIYRARQGSSINILDAIKLLLNYGARVNPVKYCIDTQFSEYGGADVVNYFKGGRCDKSDEYLSMCASSHHNYIYVEIMRELLRHGCDTNERPYNFGSKTPLENLLIKKKENYHQMKNNIDMMIELLQNGVEWVEKKEQAEKYKKEQEERCKREQEERHRREQEERYRKEQEEKRRREQEEKHRKEQAEKYKKEQEERCKREQEEKRRREQEERCRREQEEKYKKEQAERHRKEQEEKQKKEQEERQRKEQEERQRKEQEERQRKEQEERYIKEQEEKQKIEYEKMIKLRMSTNSLFSGFKYTMK